MVDEVLLIHHTHTDIGYTHQQSVLSDLERRFLDIAVEAADPDATGPAAFRWTVETTLPLLEWLSTADGEQIDKFCELEADGRIEVTGMPLNITPLYGPGETVEGLRPIRILREEFGIDVTTAMNCDVNGQNWPLADALLDAGIEGFTMAVNEHFGGAPLERPCVFRWEAPSGRTLPTLNGYHYTLGRDLGIPGDADRFASTWWPRLAAHLERVDWPFAVVPVPLIAGFGDNGPPIRDVPAWIRKWNERPGVRDGDYPRMRLATPSRFWSAIKDDLDAQPVYRGDWSDFWNFGAGSSAREVGLNRESRARLDAADAIAAGLAGSGTPLAERPGGRRSGDTVRGRALHDLLMFDEHTWGADGSIRAPASDDTRAMWHQKAAHAYRARGTSLRYRRDALGELGRHLEGE
jgi:alpha-mannosidase